MTDHTAKVVRFHETGDASVLKIQQEAILSPGPDEVRLNVEAIGLNRSEVMFRNGAYLEQPVFPSKLGYEAAGIIDAVGPDVTAFKVGDRVSTMPTFSMGQYGVYGEKPIVPVSAIARYPENLTVPQATSIWMQYFTAYGALVDIGQLRQEQTVLITAASSSVGIAALQIAKILGAKTIATTRGNSKVKQLYDAGADHVIQTDSENLVERVATITNDQGANVIFDPIGGPILEQLAAAAAKGGKIIEYGALDDRATPYPLFTALGKGLAIHGYTLFEITQSKDPARLARAKDFIFQGLESGSLQPLIDRTFPFDQVQQAHGYMESNQQVGKIVMIV